MSDAKEPRIYSLLKMSVRILTGIALYIVVYDSTIRKTTEHYGINGSTSSLVHRLAARLLWVVYLAVPRITPWCVAILLAVGESERLKLGDRAQHHRFWPIRIQHLHRTVRRHFSIRGFQVTVDQSQMSSLL